MVTVRVERIIPHTRLLVRDRHCHGRGAGRLDSGYNPYELAV